MMPVRAPLVAALLLMGLAIAGCRAARAAVLDDFETLTGWTAQSSAGATVELTQDTGRDGKGLRIDFDFHGGGGYVIARKAVAVTLPENYALTFRMRGVAPPNRLEVKLVDPTGDNVWWFKQPRIEFAPDWQIVTIPKRRLEFAWGPAGGGTPGRLSAIEFGLVATTGGRGSIWIDDLQVSERQPAAPPDRPPEIRASTSLPDHPPAAALDGDPHSAWHSDTRGDAQWLLLDFGRRCAYGGLVIDWDATDYATDYRVRLSDDGRQWTEVRHSGGNGHRAYLPLPDAESRWLRLDFARSSRGHGYGIRSLTIKPFEFSASPNQFFTAIAAESPPGLYPKYFLGQQTYWTVVGTNGGHRKALLNEEGMLEVDKGGFSVEPFLFVDGALVTWHSAQTTQALDGGYRPIPSVTWHHDPLSLTITAVAAGPPEADAVHVRYRVENASDLHKDAVLFLAIRPFQVLPPWQNLNLVGGISPIHDIRIDPHTVRVNGTHVVVSDTPAARYGAAAFDDGPVADLLQDGTVPPRDRASDPSGFAAGVLAYAVPVGPRAHDDVYVTVPLGAAAPEKVATDNPAAVYDTALEATRQRWDTVLSRVEFRVPPQARPYVDALKSTLAYTLVNRDGAALQPGARTYARSWIRDGAFSSAALLELACPTVVRDFLTWFAPHQFANGMVPCCIDDRGADPVPEHDSAGEFVFTAGEYYRYTRDVGLIHDLWPSLVRAVDYLDGLRRTRMTAAYERPDRRAYFGLLPESISHEGYASHPVHSYWDDFFALRGFKDAARLAVVMGDTANATRFAEIRDAFHRDLYASLERTIADHRLDYVPASVELADFDPTSTAIAVTMCSEQGNLPARELAQTFETYYANVRARLQRHSGREGYTPYEWRNVAALVRLGQRDRAIELLEAMFADRRPATWNQWQEVTWRDPTAPEFVGDMPHTWVGSSFMQSFRTMFAYEREADASLVLAAGIPATWVDDPAGVGVRRLPTYYGVLDYTLQRDGPHTLRLRVTGDLTLPPGKLVLRPPLSTPLRGVTIDGQPSQNFSADAAVIDRVPAEVVLSGADGAPPVPGTPGPR